MSKFALILVLSPSLDGLVLRLENDRPWDAIGFRFENKKYLGPIVSVVPPIKVTTKGARIWLVELALPKTWERYHLVIKRLASTQKLNLLSTLEILTQLGHTALVSRLKNNHLTTTGYKSSSLVSLSVRYDFSLLLTQVSQEMIFAILRWADETNNNKWSKQLLLELVRRKNDVFEARKSNDTQNAAVI